MPKKSWSVPTSPRSPYKIREELQVLTEFEGKIWDNEAQEQFSKKLAEGPFKGELPDNEDWAGRARYGTMKYWGFAYVDDTGKLRITNAGRALLTTTNEPELFLRQFLKWQYPDNNHGGNEYPREDYNLFPFIAVCKIIEKTKSLSKDEIALFMFTLTKMEQIPEIIDKILHFRDQLKKRKGKVPRKKYIVESFAREINRVFKSDMKKKIGDFNQTALFPKDTHKLQSEKTHNLQEYVRKARCRFYDYADALQRYLRYTSLLSVEGHSLVIAKNADFKVKSVARMKMKLYPYQDTKRFYDYYGDPDIVQPPYENTQDLINSIQKWIKTNDKVIEELTKISPGITIERITIPEKLPSTVTELKNLEYLLREHNHALNSQILAVQLRDRKQYLGNIIEMYSQILKRDVIEPATYLEWNTWRAFLSLDVAKNIKPYLKLDDNMQPISPAGGNLPDMEVHYDDFILVVEVTLKSGGVQWRDEAEPVPVHVINVKRQYPQKEVYGLFIAPKIADRTKNVFYGAFTTSDMFGSTVSVNPLTIEQFKNVLTLFTEFEYEPKMIHTFMKQLEASRSIFSGLAEDKGIKWVDNFENIISGWRSQLITQSGKQPLSP